MLVTDEGPLRIVTIAKPECRNAVGLSTADNFRAAFEEFDRGDALSGAILTGAGLNFCSGFDLRAVGHAGWERNLVGDGPMGPSCMLLPKPVLAAVEGYAVGWADGSYLPLSYGLIAPIA